MLTEETWTALFFLIEKSKTLSSLCETVDLIFLGDGYYSRSLSPYHRSLLLDSLPSAFLATGSVVLRLSPGEWSSRRHSSKRSYQFLDRYQNGAFHRHSPCSLRCQIREPVSLRLQHLRRPFRWPDREFIWRDAEGAFSLVCRQGNTRGSRELWVDPLRCRCRW